MLREFLLLWPTELEGGRALHEGHRIGRLVEGAIPVVTVLEWMGVVEPTWHTHIDMALQRPIWTKTY